MQITATVTEQGQSGGMQSDERQPGEAASNEGAYEELNIFGTPTGRTVLMAAGDRLPDAPRGFTWRPLSAHTVAELRARAAEYRRMAGTARTADVADGLRRLAERFETLAAQREQQSGGAN